MLGLDVGDDQPGQLGALESSEGFIHFEDEQRIGSVVGVGAEVDQIPTDHKGRVEAQSWRSGG